MPKQVVKTPEIITQIQKIAGADVDVSNLAVFECIALNTLPINKRGSIFDKGRFTETTLTEMVEYLNTNGVPLHTLHAQGYELPIGKVFAGQVVVNDRGLLELRAMFYVAASEKDVVDKLDTGVIDEVSVGFLAKHLLCSECGFDYFGDEATSENFWSRTCNNDHTIGEKGVHLSISGLDRFFELSLVSQGAAQNAKIVSRSKALMASEPPQRLAASGIAVSAAALFTSVKEESQDMATESIVELANSFANAKVELTQALAQVATLTNQVSTITGERDTALAQVVTLTGQVDTKLADVQAELNAGTGFLRDLTLKMKVALGETDPKVDEMSVVDMVSAIGDAQTKLATIIPVGGTAMGSVEDIEQTEELVRLSAFKTRK